MTTRPGHTITRTNKGHPRREARRQRAMERFAAQLLDKHVEEIERGEQQLAEERTMTEERKVEVTVEDTEPEPEPAEPTVKVDVNVEEPDTEEDDK